MPSVISSCEKHFQSTNLYEVLGVSKDATDKELKKAYHRQSLKIHPDRVQEEEKEIATEKFQILGKVYSILTDKDRRAVYDETGEVDDENDPNPDKDWEHYWRLLFKMDKSDIINFEKKYRNSEEELDDLKAAYIEAEGDMNLILETVLCCTIDDEPRFEKIIKDWIKKKEVPSFDKFTKETKAQKSSRKRAAAKEAKEAEELSEELGLGSGADSFRAIFLGRLQQHEAEMDSFLDSLANKYGKPKAKGAKKGAKK